MDSRVLRMSEARAGDYVAGTGDEVSFDEQTSWWRVRFVKADAQGNERATLQQGHTYRYVSLYDLYTTATHVRLPA